jgi:hypothetical protein
MLFLRLSLFASTHHDLAVSYNGGIRIVPAAKLCRPSEPLTIGTGDTGARDCSRHWVHFLSVLLSNSTRQYTRMG